MASPDVDAREAYKEADETQEEKDMAWCSITNKALLVPRPPWPTNCTELDTTFFAFSLAFPVPVLRLVRWSHSLSLCPPLPLRWQRLNHKPKPRASLVSVTQPSYSTILYYSPRFL